MRRPFLWAGACALLSTVAAVALAIGILGGSYRAVERSDYVTYQTAGLIVLHGDGVCLYTPACQAVAQHELIGDEPSFTRGALPFNSPPWLAALAAPLALLPLHLAFGIFTTLSLLLLGFAAWRLAWGGAATRAVATLLLLSAWPTVMGAIRGQSSLAVAGLLGLSVMAAGSGMARRSGALLGLSAFKPTLGPLWLARMALDRRWPALLAAAGVGVVLIAISALVVSPRAVLDYPAYLLGTASDPNALGIHVEQMINWRGAAVRLGVAGSPLAAVGVAVTLLAVVAAWWWGRGSDRATPLAAAAAFLATPLVIPHANQHEAILASLGVLILVAALPELRGRLAAAAIASQAVLWIGPALDPQASAWLLFGMLLAWLCIAAALLWREGKRVLPSGSGA
ncbi:MAG: glycosyltransferase family 87 protein [Candidatus Limnocylindria bacterium]